MVFDPQLVYKLRSRRPDIATAIIWRKNFVGFHDVEGLKPRYKDSPIRQFVAELLDPVLEWAIHSFLWHVTGVGAVSIHKVSSQNHCSYDLIVDYRNSVRIAFPLRFLELDT